MGKRPTIEERRDRLKTAKRLLSQGLRNGPIKKAMARHYDISPRSVEPYLRRAREALREELGMSKEELRAEAYGFYRWIVGNQSEDTGTRLQAQKRIDKLLGLEGPVKVEQTDTTACDSATRDARDTFYDILAELRERAVKTDGKQPAPNGGLRLPDATVQQPAIGGEEVTASRGTGYLQARLTVLDVSETPRDGEQCYETQGGQDERRRLGHGCQGGGGCGGGVGAWLYLPVARMRNRSSELTRSSPL